MKKIATCVLIWAFAATAQSVETPVFTYDTVATYSESNERALRWADGVVKIWDQTGILNKNPEVLNVLNTNLGDVQLHLTQRENEGMIQIRMVDTLPAPYATGCGLTMNSFDPMRTMMIKADIKIRNKNNCMERDGGTALMFHELGHALGFSKHAKEDDVMSIHDPSYAKETLNLTTLQYFLTGLYSLKPGSVIPLNDKMPVPKQIALGYKRILLAAPASISSVIDPSKNSTASAPKERIPETLVVHPSQHYQRIEKMGKNGPIWEFALIDDASSPVVPGVQELPSCKGNKFSCKVTKTTKKVTTLETIGPSH